MSIKRFMNKKVVAIGLAAGITLGGAGAAFAYFTSSGSGPGSASVGSSTALDITQTNVTALSGLTPNGVTLPVQYKIANPTGNGAQTLGTVTASIDSISGPNDTNTGVGTTCTSADFTITPSANSVGSVGDGDTFTSDTGTEPTIQMKDTGLNQDGCEGAALVLTITAAAGA
jgi:hypothetical protein